MRLILLTIFSTLILSSCLTPSKIDKICRSCPHSDSVVVKTMIERFRYDSLIYITTAPDTLKIASPCDSTGNLRPFDIVQKKHGIRIEIKSVGNQIIAEANADSLADTVKGLNTMTKEKIDTVKTKTIITNECPETWWQTLYRWSAWIFYSCIILTIIITVIHIIYKL